MRENGLRLTVSLLIVMLVLAGCGREAAPPPAAKSALGPVPPATQRPGDPAAGYAALVNEPYISCGIPYRAYRRTAAPVAPAERLPGRKGRNAELPYRLTSYTTAGGVELVTYNCLGCHAAFFNGKLVIGLGNETGDFTGDPSIAAESAGTYVRGEEETAEWQKWANRLSAVYPHARTETVGMNPATIATWLLIAHRDASTLAWSEEPLLDLPQRPPLPVSVPPWWRMQKKHAMFYNAAGRKDHARIMMAASLMCTDTVEEAKRIDAYFTDVRAYIASLEPPEFPFPIDSDLAERGRAHFEAHCASCHGTYGTDGAYPNLVLSLDAVGTDPAYALDAVSHEDRFIRWFNRSFYGEVSQLAPAPGYIAPPLDGVWATPPYLHNGSIPTLDALLNSSHRPKYWLHPGSSPEYDPTVLGWRVTELSYGKSGAVDFDELKHIYDTTLMGYGNGGHTFGDRLSQTERMAVLEYLKTL